MPRKTRSPKRATPPESDCLYPAPYAHASGQQLCMPSACPQPAGGLLGQAHRMCCPHACAMVQDISSQIQQGLPASETSILPHYSLQPVRSVTRDGGQKRSRKAQEGHFHLWQGVNSDIARYGKQCKPSAEFVLAWSPMVNPHRCPGIILAPGFEEGKAL
jgi:hypothetical protein